MNIFITKPKFLFFSIFLSTAYCISGQNEAEPSCGTTTSAESLEYIHSIKPQIKKYEQEFAFSKSGKNNTHRIINSIPIKAHIIRSSNGSGGLSTSDLYNAIENLNSIYADAFMEFFLCDDINYIDDDILCHFKKGNESGFKEKNYTSGLINIYFINYVENTSEESICGYSNNIGRDNDIIIMKNSCATNGSSLAHELGHFFSLVHTHGPDNGNMTTELVDGSNCDTDGDGICDTPADPKLSSNNVNNFCEFTGIETDANGHTFNPDTGNLMSYSRKSCRNHFTSQQLARMYAFYQTTKNYLACSSFNANFSADVSTTCEETLTVNFSNNCANVTNWQWDVDSDGIVDYTNQNPSHTYDAGIYDVTLTVSNKSKTIKKTFSKFIKVGTEIDQKQEDFEGFEIAGDNGWTAVDVSNNGYNWYSNSGKTTSGNATGPLNDNTSEGAIGTYIYAEASGVSPGDVAEFISPCINVTTSNTKLEFSYHMFGGNIGELHVDIETNDGYINDVIPALYGSQHANQSDPFLKQSVNLSSYENQTIKVRFRAIRGASWDGDIAIDDISIKSIDENQDTSNSLANTKIYPNPITSTTLYIKAINSEDVINYQIANLVGQVFLSGTLRNQNQPIDVSSLSSGTYFLTISSVNSRIIKKIIK
ncbi:T9SS type A sorting domain-containing protein [Flavivirga aquimarina]|uniref:T9SS type A sorting domain-containing protein n=1 Tax=Flavivirga aquimarina TaxID=2027862 RepID=A0ABT8WBG2_9FLAO|nr:T9SS type A sorting domain-containing protein [Flavivirga aquimarina]MDO5970455.1 T9SS type A sorting domain-containing protein [Flavivirga aquimarina]